MPLFKDHWAVAAGDCKVTPANQIHFHTFPFSVNLECCVLLCQVGSFDHRRPELYKPQLKVHVNDRGWRDFGHLIDHEANRNSGDENIFAEGVGGRATKAHNIP